jgi:hypothetical protein
LPPISDNIPHHATVNMPPLDLSDPTGCTRRSSTGIRCYTALVSCQGWTSSLARHAGSTSLSLRMPGFSSRPVASARRVCRQGGKLREHRVLRLRHRPGASLSGFRRVHAGRWVGDLARRRDAGIPDDLVFATKPQLAMDQLERPLAAGLRKLRQYPDVHTLRVRSGHLPPAASDTDHSPLRADDQASLMHVRNCPVQPVGEQRCSAGYLGL